MTAILVNEGQTDQINILNANAGPNMRVGLYTARAVYSKLTVLADITVCTFSGYAVQTPAFVAFGIDANGKTQFAAVLLTYTHNGGGVANTVIGYYVFNTVTGKLYWIEDFGAPITLNSNGQNIGVKPDWFCGDLTTPF